MVLGILALALMAIGLLMWLPGGRAPDPDPKLPWRITAHADGSASVFGLTLGTSTLAEARRILGDTGEATLFLAPGGALTLEVFFQQVFLSGLRADFVLGLDLDPGQAQAMFERGERMATLGSGTRKISLAAQDLARLGDLPVRHVTYLPMADLAPSLLETRFGAPAERIPEAGTDVMHWLYPDQGLDIAVSPGAKEVFQYVSPRDFARLIAPLRDPPGRPPTAP